MTKELDGGSAKDVNNIDFTALHIHFHLERQFASKILKAILEQLQNQDP